MTYEYVILRSQNGMVGQFTTQAALNDIGKRGGELVAVVSEAPGVLLLFIKHSVAANV